MSTPRNFERKNTMSITGWVSPDPTLKTSPDTLGALAARRLACTTSLTNVKSRDWSPVAVASAGLAGHGRRVDRRNNGGFFGSGFWGGAKTVEVGGVPGLGPYSRGNSREYRLPAGFETALGEIGAGRWSS